VECKPKRIYTYLVCIYEAKAFLKLANSKPCRLGSQCYRKQGLQEQGSEANQACRVKAMQACIATAIPSLKQKPFRAGLQTNSQ